MKRIMLSLIACLMLFIICAGFSVPVYAVGTAPIAENLELKTFVDTSTSGQLSAYDPDGDIISFEISTFPVKGDIKVEDDGSFVYTPREEKKGKDYFGYKAHDSEGNISQEATVIIKIEKTKKCVDYIDMQERKGEYAAVLLSKCGIFEGERIGECSMFFPDRAVTCKEFYSMCAAVCKKEPETEIDKETEEEAISKNEAAVCLNHALGLNDVNYGSHITRADDAEVQACMNLCSVGLMDASSYNDEILTREEAALMLAKALEIIENR